MNHDFSGYGTRSRYYYLIIFWSLSSTVIFFRGYSIKIKYQLKCPVHTLKWMSKKFTEGGGLLQATLVSLWNGNGRRGVYKDRVSTKKSNFNSNKYSHNSKNCTLHSFFKLCVFFSDSKSRNFTYILTFWMVLHRSFKICIIFNALHFFSNAQ